MPILRKYTGEATGVWRHFQRKILFFPYPGKRISRRSEFSLTDANGVCVENLEEGNSMYLGETLEIEDSWKNDHKKRMISLKSDRAGLYITGMIGSNHFLGKFSTNSILILLIMVLAIGCDMILLHYIHREIHRPLDHLMRRSRRLKTEITSRGQRKIIIRKNFSVLHRHLTV